MTTYRENATIFLQSNIVKKKGFYHFMMYMHYCKNCSRLHMLNGHKVSCPSCENPLNELNISYLSYTNMDAQSRNVFLQELGTEDGLRKYTTTYRMLKYNKWFKEQTALAP